MSKTNAEIEWLTKENNKMLEQSELYMMTSACRLHGISSVSALEVLKYFDKKYRPTTRIPLVLIEWIVDVDLLEAKKRQKFLKKMSKANRNKFEKYKVGREIKVRYRFKDKPKAIQDKKLLEVYNDSLARYLKERGFGGVSNEK
ncbi:hypothetical protein RZE82_06980 [Mollicutes bacterium LVI A0039]|nr:hypothetical protein RZE82_06980 [Mollicutes bacterium LVI A0039]